MSPLPPRILPYFPPSMRGAERVAYLLAAALDANGEQSRYVMDRGHGEFTIDGTFNLPKVIESLVANAPPEAPLWWDDGPILDAAHGAVDAVVERTQPDEMVDRREIAKAVLQVAHRAGYAPVREEAMPEGVYEFAIQDVGLFFVPTVQDARIEYAPDQRAAKAARWVHAFDRETRERVTLKRPTEAKVVAGLAEVVADLRGRVDAPPVSPDT